MTNSDTSSQQHSRSELLRASIEFVNDDELIVLTDTNGSTKLRGSTNVPMFLALWNAPKHRLPLERFLDVDRRTSHTNLERHRARLCSRLQEVLIEVVADDTSVRMQVCRE